MHYTAAYGDFLAALLSLTVTAQMRTEPELAKTITEKAEGIGCGDSANFYYISNLNPERPNYKELSLAPGMISKRKRI